MAPSSDGSNYNAAEAFEQKVVEQMEKDEAMNRVLSADTAEGLVGLTDCSADDMVAARLACIEEEALNEGDADGKHR